MVGSVISVVCMCGSIGRVAVLCVSWKGCRVLCGMVLLGLGVQRVLPSSSFLMGVLCGCWASTLVESAGALSVSLLWFWRQRVSPRPRSLNSSLSLWGFGVGSGMLSWWFSTLLCPGPGWFFGASWGVVSWVPCGSEGSRMKLMSACFESWVRFCSWLPGGACVVSVLLFFELIS